MQSNELIILSSASRKEQPYSPFKPIFTIARCLPDAASPPTLRDVASRVYPSSSMNSCQSLLYFLKRRYDMPKKS